MISYSLKCDQGHAFDSWFQSSAAFDTLLAAGMVTCAVCGSMTVAKSVMAPRVCDSRKSAAPGDAAKGPLRQTDAERAQALTEMRRTIEANSDYVGQKFAQEARDMHDGLIPLRAIYGEAKPEDARQLIEDGVPVAPLPFTPGRKTN